MQCSFSCVRTEIFTNYHHLVLLLYWRIKLVWVFIDMRLSMNRFLWDFQTATVNLSHLFLAYLCSRVIKVSYVSGLIGPSKIAPNFTLLTIFILFIIFLLPNVQTESQNSILYYFQILNLKNLIAKKWEPKGWIAKWMTKKNSIYFLKIVPQFKCIL